MAFFHMLSKHSPEEGGIKYVNRMIHLACLRAIDSILGRYTQNDDACEDPNALGNSVDWLTVLKGYTKSVDCSNLSPLSLRLVQVVLLLSSTETLTGGKKQRDEKLYFCMEETLEHVSKFPEFEDEGYQSVFTELKRMLGDFKSGSVSDDSLLSFRDKVLEVVCLAAYCKFPRQIDSYFETMLSKENKMVDNTGKTETAGGPLHEESHIQLVPLIDDVHLASTTSTETVVYKTSEGALSLAVVDHATGLVRPGLPLSFDSEQQYLLSREQGYGDINDTTTRSSSCDPTRIDHTPDRNVDDGVGDVANDREDLEGPVSPLNSDVATKINKVRNNQLTFKPTRQHPDDDDSVRTDSLIIRGRRKRDTDDSVVNGKENKHVNSDTDVIGMASKRKRLDTGEDDAMGAVSGERMMELITIEDYDGDIDRGIGENDKTNNTGTSTNVDIDAAANKDGKGGRKKRVLAIEDDTDSDGSSIDIGYLKQLHIRNKGPPPLRSDIQWSSDESVDVPPAYKSQTKKPNVKNRRQKHEWTFLEEEYLRKGVKLFGVGSWMKIRRNFPFPDYRTNVDLKDKWRCLERRK